jgi:hypothetical protein
VSQSLRTIGVDRVEYKYEDREWGGEGERETGIR